MVRLGSLESKGVPVGLHSDSPMAPLSPLTLMWTAVARENISGEKTGQGEVMSRYGALKAITIDGSPLPSPVNARAVLRGVGSNFVRILFIFL